MSLASGARLGPYEIVSALGEVYKARDTRLDRIVAIKVLPETLAGDPQFRERFEREVPAITSTAIIEGRFGWLRYRQKGQRYGS